MRRLLSIVLCICMLISLMPTVYAEDAAETEPKNSQDKLAATDSKEEPVERTALYADWSTEELLAEYLRLDALEDDEGIDALFAALSAEQQAALAAALAAPVGDVPSEQANIIASGECGKNGDNLTWMLDESGTLTISGEGEMADYHYKKTPWSEYAKVIKTAVLSVGVTSIGDYAFSACEGLTSIKIPNSVTSIGSSAFNGCSSLTSIEIPNSVTSIGKSAFYRCSGLTSIELPDSVTSIGSSAFDGCSSLTSIEIPNSVTSIGSWVFRDCTNLTSIEIPDSVTSIGEGAFSGCSSLTSIEIPDSVTSIGIYAFSRCSSLTSIEIPDSVTSVGLSFGTCSSLTEIIVSDGNKFYSSIDGVLYNKDKTTLIECPGGKKGQFIITDGVTSIGKNAFAPCSSLTSIIIPNSVTSIGENAFSGCRGLTSIEIPSSVTIIPFYAFSDCTSLADVYYGGTEDEWKAVAIKSGNESLTNAKIHFTGSSIVASGTCGANLTWTLDKDGVLTITGTGAMKNFETTSSPWNKYVNAIKRVVISEGATNIGNWAFVGCTNMTSVEISDSVISIGEWAFVGCIGLTSIELPNSVTSIGNAAFDGCSGLTSIILPDSITAIGSYAFENCSSLTSIEIPDGITSIGYQVFCGCSSMKSVVIPNSVTSIGEYAFDNCTSLTDVYYGGTEDEWTEITIGSGNDDLKNAKIHFIGSNLSIEPSITVADDNTATAEVDSTHVDALVSLGIEKIHIDVTDTDAENVTVNIPAKAVDTIANNNMPVQLDTPAANLTIPAETMQSIQAQTSDELSISVYPTKIPETLPTGIEKNSLACAVSVLVNNGDITTFEGKTLTIDIPVDDGFKVNRTYKVLVISADGSSELLNGKCIQGENGKYVQVTTTHLSVFIPMLDEQQDDVLIGDANGDGKINGKDAIILKQYLAQMPVEISEASCDLNKDGKINGKDAILLLQMLANM